MSNWFIAANAFATNSCANTINCKAKLIDLTTKPNNSIANYSVCCKGDELYCRQDIVNCKSNKLKPERTTTDHHF